MSDYGTGINPNGTAVTFRDCDICHTMMAAGATGHSQAGDPSDTEPHKRAIAERERAK